MKKFTAKFGINIVNSTPYYAQANGKAEATKKAIKANIQRMIGGNPR